MKIHTCALMPFEANDAFFTRDSGLLCHSLRALGIESKVVMPVLEATGKVDPPEIIRASPDEMIDPEWWKSLGIDAVVFIAWGFKQHTPMIRAARRAGIQTCAIIETSGNPFPYGEIGLTVQTFWRKGRYVDGFLKRLVGTAVRSLYFGAKGLTDQYHRSVQIGTPHIAAFDTPSGMERCLKVARMFPWIEWQSRAILLGYPIPDFFAPLSREERRINVVSIARWDALRHKRPHVLMAMIDRVLPIHPDVTFEIFGRLIPCMERWHAELPDGTRNRVLLRGVQPSALISEAIGSSCILYCPSATDGIPLAVVEGLCGGCSVVGLETPDVAGLYWAAGEGDGSFAVNDSATAHTEAVLAELEAWRLDRRDPLAISDRWKHWFSARQVAQRTIELFSSPAELSLN
jgi:glycosyltransferase involved in cell wall biosynthesis